jgi:hypothetical protein
MKQDFTIHSPLKIDVIYIGREQQPIVVVDNLLQFPEAIIDYAEDGIAFQKNPNDFYPGVRKPFETEYSHNLCQSMENTFRRVFNIAADQHIEVMSCVLSMATTAPHELRPIQSVPHIDSCSTSNIAGVHYLCQPHHGGTSFYRHRQTGFESIDEQKLKTYAPMLKNEVMADRSGASQYMNGDTAIFERIGQIDAKFNRAIFYRSNILHSGNVQSESGLSDKPRSGRLTANTLICAR